MLRSFSRVLLTTSIFVAGMSLSPLAVPAGANQVQLHELLFNRKKREAYKQKRRVLASPQSAPPKTVKKQPAAKPQKDFDPESARITGPQYYTYKPVRLSDISLAALLPDVESTGSIAVLAAQVNQPVLPPMLVLSPEGPLLEGDNQFDQAVKTETVPTLNLAPVIQLEPAPQNDLALVPVKPTQGTQIGIPAPVLLQSAPIRLASKDYFAIAAGQAPQTSLRVESDAADAIRAAYASKMDFFWSDGVDISDQGKALHELLENAADHGLEPAHYRVDLPVVSHDRIATANALIAFDVALTARAIRFARDLKDGVIEPNKLSGYHDFKGSRLTAQAALKGLTDGIDPITFLASLAPQQPEYAILKSELASLTGAIDETIQFPEKVFLKPGTTNDVLPLVIKAATRKVRDETKLKHAETLAAYTDGIDYNEALVAFVRDVQRDLGLKPDGIVGARTVAALGGESVAGRVGKIQYAMERLRWHPENYGKRQVVINQPEYRVRYLENGKTALAMNVVVGKPANQTYFFHDEIETVVFNPYWGVPQSIIVNEMLPRLRRDPGYLDRAGYVVTTAANKPISSSAINWNSFSNSVPYNVRQKPGPQNALGELKILFPNEHAIYMHDTPAKNLFSRDTRAFSHGCVRLEDPRAMAAAVLGKNRSYVESQLGGYEKGERLSEKVPVYVAYFTAWPDDEGAVKYHPDMYKRDEHLAKAISAVAETRL